jgi:hypothetical protein
MSNYYEPHLFLSTPEHPNTMGVMLKLSKPVDGKILRDTVERLRERFPYFYARAVPEGNDLIPVENPLPMTVRNTWVAIRLNAEESNFHLAAWKYEGQRVAFEISHSLTDGAGVLPYIKSAMYLYLSQKTGEAFAPAGFRLPGDKIPESETGNPFPDLDIDSVEEPIYQKKTTADFYRLNRTGEIEPQIFYLKLPEAQVMKYCRDNDGSPNVFCSVMLAKAARRCDPEGDKTISVAVAIDHKAMLGNHDNYRMFANVVEVDFPKSRSLEDVMKACTIARGQIMLQAQPENSMWAVKQRKALSERFAQMPLDMKTGAMSKMAGSPRWSISVSYANSRSFGPLDPYIEELYLMGEPGVTDVCCEIACINQNFFLAILQNFNSYTFIDAFLEELKLTGIDCEVMGREALKLCGLKAF